MKIAVNVIATGKYIQFVQPLVDSIEKYFLIGHDITINLFTDAEPIINVNRTKFVIHKIPSYKFPEATLLRYHVMTGISYDCDYIYYFDADMSIVDFIGEEFLADILAVRHPGYYMLKGSGAWETREESITYISPENRKRYYCGGVQGGSKVRYLTAMFIMRKWITIDIATGIIPIWHDESVWNKYLISGNFEELDPSYCMPQSIAKRNYSRISHLPAKILALEKENDIRE